MISIDLGVLASRAVVSGLVTIAANTPAFFIGRKGLIAFLADIAVHCCARLFSAGEVDAAWMAASHSVAMIRRAQIKAPKIKGCFTAV
jgi:hypothetical protein